MEEGMLTASIVTLLIAVAALVIACLLPDFD
jgi:hypothetical protein